MTLSRFAGYRFRPRWLPTLLTVVVVSVLLGLGGWQLNRAEQKRALVDARDQALKTPPLTLNGLQGQLRDLRFRRVVVRGRYLVDNHLLLDNQILRGRAGYHVLSAFEISGSEALLLVNRGWVPVGEDRSVLPDIPNRTGDREIGGTLDAFPRIGIRLAPDVVVSDGWPLLVLELIGEELARSFQRPVLPMVLKLAPEPDAAYDREWVWLESFGPERHLGYAFQWYALAFALLVIYLVVNFRASSQSDLGEHGGQGANARR